MYRNTAIVKNVCREHYYTIVNCSMIHEESAGNLKLKTANWRSLIFLTLKENDRNIIRMLL